MKLKYIEERFGRYVSHGDYLEDTAGSSIYLKDEGIKKYLIDDRNQLLRFILSICDAFEKADSEAFIDFYYHDSVEENEDD